MHKLQMFLFLAVSMTFQAPATRAAEATINCIATASVPSLIRAEGVTERLSGVWLNCSGTGLPGAVHGPFDVSVSVGNTVFTNRITGGDVTDALLVVQESDGSNGLIVPGRLEGANSIIFENVSFRNPGTLYITNLRVNASMFPMPPGGAPGQVQLFVLPAPPATLTGLATQIAGFILPGMGFALRRASDSAPVSGLVFNHSGGHNAALAMSPTAAGGTIDYRLSFSAAIKTGFMRRNIATTILMPDALADQDTPGAVYDTETGFYLSDLGDAGLATQGTRLMARFANIPPGVALFATVERIPAGAGATGYARMLSSADPNGADPYSAALKTTSASLNGTPLDIAPIPIYEGTGQAVWEVLSNSTSSDSTFEFGLVVAYPATAPGTAPVNGLLGPTGSGVGDATSPVPRFNGDLAISSTLCGSGTCVSQDLPGSLSVSTNNAGATFTIAGPSNYTGNGLAWVQSNVPAGVYTITYGAVAGYNKPAPESKTLTSGESLSFTGTYTAIAPPPVVFALPLSVDTDRLFFQMEHGVAAQSQSVGVSYEGGRTWFTVQNSAPWIRVSQVAGTTPANVTITTDVTGMKAGAYSTILWFVSSDPRAEPKPVRITLYLEDPPRLISGRNALEYLWTAGMPAPGDTVHVVATTRNIDCTVESSANWLKVTSGANTTPLKLTVSVDATGLNPGSYTGDITITSKDATNSPLTIPVSLQVR
jgi:hypothetical protein